MTFSELSEEVTLITGEVAVDILTLLRRAENDFIEKTKCTEKVTAVATSGQGTLSETYSLATILTSTYPFVEEHRVEWEGQKLDPIHRRANIQMYDSDDSAYDGFTSAYEIEGDTIRLIPKPNAHGTLRIWFSYRNSSTSGASPIIPTIYHKILPDKVMSQIFSMPKYRDVQLAAFHESKYENKTEAARLDVNRRRFKQYRVDDVVGRPGMDNISLILNSQGEDGWTS